MANNSPTSRPYKFPGFSAPTYTPIPDIVFDELAHRLSGSEYKVLMYILRRTFGFKKESDSISFNQMLKGITKQDGTRLDYGAGISSPATLSKAVNKLVELGVIIAIKNTSAERGNEATIYIPNMGQGRESNTPQEKEHPPTTKNEVGGTSKNEVALLQKVKTQETVLQETVQQHVVVADLLIKNGIAKGVAKKLAKQFSQEYVEEKIAYLNFLLDTDPTKVKSPKGWLRIAIEQDFAAPDGYKTPKQLAAEKEASKEAREALEAKKRRIEAEARVREQEDVRRAKVAAQKLRELEKEHNTTAQIRDQWVYAKEQSQLTFPGSLQLQSVFQSCHLIKIEDGVATVVCFNKVAGQWLETKFDRLIKRQLQMGDQEEVKKITAVYVPLNGEE